MLTFIDGEPLKARLLLRGLICTTNVGFDMYNKCEKIILMENVLLHHILLPKKEILS